jgi:hypothetical protein
VGITARWPAGGLQVPQVTAVRRASEPAARYYRSYVTLESGSNCSIAGADSVSCKLSQSEWHVTRRVACGWGLPGPASDRLPFVRKAVSAVTLTRPLV